MTAIKEAAAIVELSAAKTINQLYQTAVNKIWWRNQRDEPWASTCVKVPAVSLYPNIAAEMEASRNSAATVKDHARISGDILAAVLEDREPLAAIELYRLSGLWQCSWEYLGTDTLQVVDPSTNKGKFRRRQLRDLLAVAADVNCFDRTLIENTLADLETGKVVTYARWRWSMHDLRFSIGRYRPRTIRSSRIA